MRGVPLHWRLFLGFLARLPQGILSRAWGRFAELSFPPPVQRAVNRTFARLTGVNISESELLPSEYPTLSNFFSRALRAGARQWPNAPAMPASPVDGILGAFGVLDRGVAIQAKGLTYPVGDLLAETGAGDFFVSGLFFTIYLAPRHYHRIHAPVEGRIREARAVPGRLLPVNVAATRSIEALFPRNERLVVLMDAPRARLALVAVGAFNVGRISAAFDPGWNGPQGRGVTNRRKSGDLEARRYDPPLRIVRGQEVMAFHFGSTVVLLLESVGPACLPAPHPDLREGMEIRVGAPLLSEPLSSSRE
ncbi:MAG: archaetidylserine decarboxylase [Gemmatimonadota bacterium]